MVSAWFTPVLQCYSFTDLQGLTSAMKSSLLTILKVLTLALEPELHMMFLDADSDTHTLKAIR